MTGKGDSQTSASWPIRRMSHIVDRHLVNVTKALQPLGLTAPMWRVLNGLAEGGDSSVGDLADHAAFERSYVSRLVARMAELGLVQASGDASDRRFRNVTLTDDGRTKQAAALALVARLNQDSLKGLSEAEVKTLTKLLDRVALNIGADRPK
jgi:DNA-binding MarR family transcriptional regulator